MKNKTLPIFGILLTLLEVGVGYGAFKLAEGAGASPVVAYTASSLGPILGFLVFWIKDKRISGMSLAMLAFTLLSAAVAFIGNTDPKWLVYKDSLVTGGIGLAFALSVLARRPLCYYFAQRFSTDGSQEGVDAFDANWQYLEFRRIFQWCSVWMGAVFVVEAVVKIVITYVSSFDDAVLMGTVLPLGAVALAMVGMLAIGRFYGKRARAKGWDGSTGNTHPTLREGADSAGEGVSRSRTLDDGVDQDAAEPVG